MAQNDEICDLMAENGNMKALLKEILPEMRCRVNMLRERWPRREILLDLHRCERIVEDIEEFLVDFEDF